MLKLFSIYFLLIFCCYAKFIKPEEGAILSYTHIDFLWEQQPNTNSYRLQVYDQDSVMILNQIVEKTLYIDHNNFRWNNSYSSILSILQNDNGNIEWSDTLSFSIAPKIPSTDLNIDFIDNDVLQDGLMFFSQVSPTLAMVVVDKNGNQIWNSNFAYITSWNEHGQLFGMKNGRGVELNFYNQISWMTPQGTEMDAHEFKQLSNGNYMGVTTDYQLGPIPIGPWTESYQNLGYLADGITNEFTWRATKISEWDSQTNEMVWDWNPFDFFTMEDYDSIEGRWWSPLNGSHYGMLFDWNHTNAFHFDDSENMIYVSNRNLSRITKISYPSKEVVWNMGPPDIYGYGDENICTDLLFSCQHHIQMLYNGDLLFFDNGKLSELFNSDQYPTTRIRRIRVHPDFACETIWQYDLPQELYAHSWGSVQLLENGNYFFYSHGSGHDNGSFCTMIEISAEENLIWKASHQIPQSVWYRGFKIPSIHPTALSVVFDKFRNIQYGGSNFRGIIIDDVNRSLNFTLYNESNYRQEISYHFADSLGWFENINDTIIINPQEQHHVNLFPTQINDSLNNNLTLNINFPKHAFANQIFKYKIYYMNGVLTVNEKSTNQKFLEYIQNYPNPFNATTTFKYELAKVSDIKITIFDLLGNVVKYIIIPEQPIGENSVIWDTTNYKGQPVSAGVYIYSIETGQSNQTKKMILLK